MHLLNSLSEAWKIYISRSWISRLQLLRTARIIDEEEYRFYDRLRRLRNYYEHQAKEEFPPRNKVEPILIELKRRFNEVKAMFKPERRRPREPSYIT